MASASNTVINPQVLREFILVHEDTLKPNSQKEKIEIKLADHELVSDGCLLPFVSLRGLIKLFGGIFPPNLFHEIS